jgi:hypothetical protein
MEKLTKSYTITPPSAKTQFGAGLDARKTATFSGREGVFFRTPSAPVYSGGVIVKSVRVDDLKKTETISERVLRLKNEPLGVIYDDDAQMMKELDK